MRRKKFDPNRLGWQDQLDVLKADLESMPPGLQRDQADRRARQLEAAIMMEQSLRPTGPNSAG